MRPNPIALVDDRLDMPIEGDDLRLDADLFHELPGERGGKRLGRLDDAAGQAEWPISGARARRTMSTRPCRKTAAETARIGRAGNNGSFIDRPLRT